MKKREKQTKKCKKITNRTSNRRNKNKTESEQNNIIQSEDERI